MFRHPKTNAERKANESAAEIGIRVRGKRRRLPTAYDAFQPRSQRCWKAYRGKQYAVK